MIVVTTNDNNYPDKEEKDYKIYRLPSFKLFKNRYPILKKNKKYKSLLKEILDENIDYIICNTRFYQTSLLGAKVAKKKKCPLLFLEHGSNHVSVGIKLLDVLGSFYEHYLTFKIKRYNPRFYGVSNKCNEWLKHFHIESSGTFYNAIDEEIFSKYYHRKKDNNKIIISYIGRIIPEKGVVMLLEAFKELSEKYKNIELIIAGDGPLLKKLKQDYNLKKVKFLGKINYEEVMELCTKTDIFVHPSMYPEGLPSSILEAGLMKCAIIATDRGGTTEVINSNDYGLIMEENKEDLIKKLQYLLDNPNIRENMKENIHKRILEKFTWQKTSEEVIKELQKYIELN